MCGKEDVGNGSTRLKQERNTKEEIYGGSERRHASGGCDRGKLSVLERDDRFS